MFFGVFEVFAKITIFAVFEVFDDFNVIEKL
jgi:hypothetical protein